MRVFFNNKTKKNKTKLLRASMLGVKPFHKDKQVEILRWTKKTNCSSFAWVFEGRTVQYSCTLTLHLILYYHALPLLNNSLAPGPNIKNSFDKLHKSQWSHFKPVKLLFQRTSKLFFICFLFGFLSPSDAPSATQSSVKCQ